MHGSSRRTGGEFVRIERKPVAATKCRGTVWALSKSNAENNRLKSRHPATFPDALARDIITCFSRPGDIVCDPFMGSGTTIVEALKLGRHARGNDINESYVALARQRARRESWVGD